MSTHKQFILNLTRFELEAWLKEHKEPTFRAAQIFDWIWKKGIFQFHDMTNLGKKLQELLTHSFSIQACECSHVAMAKNKETSKYLFKLADGACVESVLIRAPERKTVCLSSQVGCPVRCAFCASGKRGFFRNLSIAEIVFQYLWIHHELLKSEKTGIDHIVYMGMGEPLENYDNVLQSIHLFTSPDYAGISQRRITLSTVGVVEGIERLSHEKGIRINLAFSLHAPTQEIRKKIIPYARKYELDAILKALDLFQKQSHRDVTYEYTLIDGINSEKEHAVQLAKLLHGRNGSVNLIPYNPIEGVSFTPPPTAKIDAFLHELERRRIPVTCRYTKGDDIGAACGQLALKVSI